MAHDLRNPLWALQLIAGRSLRATDASGRERELAEQVVDQLRQVGILLGDLVEASRIEAGHLELRLQSTDLVALTQACVRLYTGTSPQHDIVLQEVEEPLVAEVDEARLSQVLANLLSNAIKYSPGGGRIEVGLEPRADVIAIRVADEGIGIAPEHLARLFQPFERGGAPTGSSGSGLGLSACKRIIEAHGGTIAVDSARGSGATFRLFLPRRRVDAIGERALPG